METNKEIDNKQKAIIHILKAQLIKKCIIDETGYRGLLMQWFDVESSKALDYEQATIFIDDLIKMGGSIKKKPKKKLPPGIIELPSPQILKHIEHLKDDIKWFAHDRGQKFIQKFLKKDRPSTMKEAIRLVECLKAMKERQQKAKEPEAECYRDGCIRGTGRVQW